MVDTVRRHTPLVQCLTNTVVQEITANVLLAAGAAPVMTADPEESRLCAATASALLVNLGTITTEQVTVIETAVTSAVRSGTPWVLDPVAVGSLPLRTSVAHALHTRGPSAIRCNPSEAAALSGRGGGGRGVDSVDEVEDALPAATDLSARTCAVVAVSGARDLVVTGGRVTWIESGDPLMQKVIGSGCALGALTAAYLGIGTRSPGGPHAAVVAAHAHAGAAGLVAAHSATGPGSFAVAWLDALHRIDGSTVAELVSLS